MKAATAQPVPETRVGTVQTAILGGQQPADLSVAQLLRVGIPMDWTDQVRLFAVDCRGIVAARKAEDFAFP